MRLLFLCIYLTPLPLSGRRTRQHGRGRTTAGPRAARRAGALARTARDADGREARAQTYPGKAALRGGRRCSGRGSALRPCACGETQPDREQHPQELDARRSGGGWGGYGGVRCRSRRALRIRSPRAHWLRPLRIRCWPSANELATEHGAPHSSASGRRAGLLRPASVRAPRQRTTSRRVSAPRRHRTPASERSAAAVPARGALQPRRPRVGRLLARAVAAPPATTGRGDAAAAPTGRTGLLGGCAAAPTAERA